MGNKWVYAFDEVAAVERAVGGWDAVRGLLGGKGANLADMTRQELPVPPGWPPRASTPSWWANR